MGQGTESCGGYEIDYDPYEEGLSDGQWEQKNGSSIHVSKMSLTHLKNSRSLALNQSRLASFSCDSDMWLEWVDLLDNEISTRKPAVKRERLVGNESSSRGVKVELKCHCGTVYKARAADLKRGWGKSCSKSCAATRRTYGRPAAIRL